MNINRLENIKRLDSIKELLYDIPGDVVDSIKQAAELYPIVLCNPEISILISSLADTFTEIDALIKAHVKETDSICRELINSCDDNHTN